MSVEKFCCKQFEYAAGKYIGYYDSDDDFCPMTDKYEKIPDRTQIILSYYDYNVYDSVIIKFCPFCGAQLNKIISNYK